MTRPDIEQAKDNHEAELFMIDGVEGVGIGEDASGHAFIRVYVRDKETASQVPDSFDGFRVLARVSGEFEAQEEQ